MRGTLGRRTVWRVLQVLFGLDASPLRQHQGAIASALMPGHHLQGDNAGISVKGPTLSWQSTETFGFTHVSSGGGQGSTAPTPQTWATRIRGAI